MAITIQQKGIAALYGKAATLAGRAQRSRELEQRAIRKQEQLASIQAQQESQQIQIEQQRSMRMLDAQLDLEKYERARRWDIDKMQLRSQVDFQREEKERQRTIDSAANARLQIEKEVESGRVDPNDPQIKKYLAYYKMKEQFPEETPSMSLIKSSGDEDRYGVRPYYTDPEFERDFPELAAAKKRDVTEGRAGTIPYHLSPEFLRTLPPSTAQEMLENKGIFFDNDEQFEEWLVNLEGATPTVLPLGDKPLDIGVRAEQPELIFMGYGKDRISTISSDEEWEALPSGTVYIGPDGIKRTKE